MSALGVESRGWGHRLQLFLSSQWGLAIATALLFVVGWLLWENWSRAHLFAMGLGGLLAGGLLFVYPILGISLAAFTMVSNVTEYIPGSLTPILLLTLGIVIVKKLLSGDTNWTVTPFTKIAILFAIVHLVSAVWAGSYRYFEWGNFYRIILILIVFTEVVKTRQDFLMVILAAQAGTIMTGIMTVQSAADFYMTGAAEELAGNVGYIDQSRFFGIWDEPNLMALTQVPVLGMSIVLMRTRMAFWMRLISFTAVCAGLVTVMLSLSRGAALCTLLLLLTIAIADKHRLRILTGITVLAGIVITILPVDLIGRMATLLKPGSDASIGQRSELLFGGMRMIEDSFPFGVGSGNYRLYSMDFADTLPHGMIAHNTFIDIFAEAGLLGIMLFCATLFALYGTIRWRGRRLDPQDMEGNLHIGLSGSLLAVTLAMAFLSAAGYAVFWFYFTMISLLPVVFDSSRTIGTRRALG
jgi:hypothetical protein